MILQSIIYKIILGIKEWSLQELQFHKNNPELVEKELSMAQYEGPDDIYVSSALISVAERSLIHRSSPRIKRIITKPTAVLCALQHEFIIDEKVAVVTFDGNYFDIGVYNVGDGIIEELNLLSYIQDVQDVICSIEDVTSLIVVSNGKMVRRSIHNIECALNISAKCYENLKELLVQGAFIYSGVLKGLVHNVLLLPMFPYVLYCETPDNERFEFPNEIITIPTKQNSGQITTKARKLFIKQNGSNEPIAVIQLNGYSADNIPHNISIQTDIDLNDRIKFTIMDETSKEQYEIIT